MESQLEAPRLERRLIAILAADVEGYSRHMEHDEEAALATLSRLRLVVDALIVEHRGRITGTAGDSVLAEFVSVVDALDCAMKFQEAVAAEGEGEMPERRMQFRIGLNVGDVMVKDGDIFGDGVNIAARLESLALPGGICVSRGVRDHVRKMGQYSFEDLGEQSVKNIAQPIRAFRLRSTGEKPEETSAAAPLPDPTPTADDVAVELAFWDSIKEQEDPAEFTAYLEKYPDGAFAALARARHKSLMDKETAPAPVAVEASESELAFWDTVRDSTNPAMYAAYLEQYPDGSFAALAKLRLAELSEG
jgi:adenylate cyclase